MDQSGEKNREYFNKLAAELDSRFATTIKRIETEIRANVEFLGLGLAQAENDTSARTSRLLDYACGTGAITHALAPYISEAVGIDVAENMVGIYNTKVHDQRMLPAQCVAYTGNLCIAADSNPSAFDGPKFHDFDLACVGLGFHHFSDPDLAASRLVQRLRSGGVLFIVDFLQHEPFSGNHPAMETITHHGFSKDRVKAMFEQAGAGTKFALHSTIIEMDHGDGTVPIPRTVFFARGEKL